VLVGGGCFFGCGGGGGLSGVVVVWGVWRGGGGGGLVCAFWWGLVLGAAGRVALRSSPAVVPGKDQHREFGGEQGNETGRTVFTGTREPRSSNIQA